VLLIVINLKASDVRYHRLSADVVTTLLIRTFEVKLVCEQIQFAFRHFHFSGVDRSYITCSLSVGYILSFVGGQQCAESTLQTKRKYCENDW